MTYTRTDLSTLASVVTTLATMDKNHQGHTAVAAVAAIADDDGSGDTLNGDGLTHSTTAAKAFDTMSKAVQSSVLLHQVSGGRDTDCGRQRNATCSTCE